MPPVSDQRAALVAWGAVNPEGETVFNTPKRFFRLLWILPAIALLTVLVAPPRIYAQPAALAAPCYIVADAGDGVFRIDRPAWSVTFLGDLPPGTDDVEAIALSLDGSTIYAVDDDAVNGVFGTINPTTGAWTPIGPVGPGNGVDPATGLPITLGLNDIDGLSVHPWTGELWGTTRQSGTSPDNVIFRINPATGRVIPNTFGPGLDFVRVNLPPNDTDVDDLAIDPATGDFLTTSNIGMGNDDFERLLIDAFNPAASPGLDAAHGLLSVQFIAKFTYQGTQLQDVEGLAFDNLGNLYATTGREGRVGATAYDGFLWQIDKTNGAATLLTRAVTGNYGDTEAVDCRSGGLNVKAGVVFSDANGNGTFDAGDAPYSGATVRYYHDNGNGTFDGPASADVLVQTRVTDASGAYEFRVAALGTFFAVVDTTSLPAGVSLTTPGLYTVAFTDIAQSHPNNNFGFNTGGTPTPTPTVTPGGPTVTPGGPTLTPANPPGTLFTYDPGLGKFGPGSAVPGEIISFSVVARNEGIGTLTNGLVTDNLPAEFFSSVVEATATRGTVTVEGLTVRVMIGTMPPGDAVTITIRARVRLDVPPPQSAENVASFDTTEGGHLTASAVVALSTLPQTGYPPREPSRDWNGSALPVALAAAAIGVMLLGLTRRRSAR